MNVTVRSRFHQLRFLLHGLPEKYDCSEKLYLASQGNSVWNKVASKILEQWRLVPSVLTERIPRHLWNELNIQEISPQSLIAELTTDSLTGKDLSTKEERQEVLDEIAKKSEYKMLWLGLPIHEATDGKLVSITETTYRENPTFSLPSQLKSLVTMISETNRQEWVSLWTPEEAIKVILNQPQPEQFCKLIIELIGGIQEIPVDLKTTPWIPLINQRVVAPHQVIILGDRLQDFPVSILNNVFQAENSKSRNRDDLYSCNFLSTQIHKRVLERISTVWYENSLLDFLLGTTEPHTYALEILRILRVFNKKNQHINKDNLEALKSKAWLIDSKDKPRALNQIVHFPALEVKATEILEQLISWSFITSKMLQTSLDIQFCLEHPQLQYLFLSGEDAIEKIGEAISQLPQYYLGDLPIPSSLLRNLIQIFQGCDWMPIIVLAQRMSLEEFECFILPQTQHPIDCAKRLREVLKWLTEKYPHPQSEVIEVYNYYLQIACCSKSFSSEILPYISLLNQAKSWQPAEKLCDSSIYLGIQKVFLLDTHQREILNNILSEHTLKDFNIESDNTIEDNYDNNSEKLNKYFKPWMDTGVSLQAIGGFITLFAGLDSEIIEVAQSYLQRHSFQNVYSTFFPESVLSKHNALEININQGESKEVKNLLGDKFLALISKQHKSSTLFIGHLGKEVTLRSIDLDNFDYKELEDILLESIEKWIKILDKKNFNDDRRTSIRKMWSSLTQAKRLDIQVVCDLIIESSVYILRMLSVNDPSILTNVKKLQDEKYIHSMLSNQIPRDINSIQTISKKIDITRLDIKKLIEDNYDAQTSILEAVRKKIKTYGYSHSSILFELFQNADDSVNELFDLFAPNNIPDRNYRRCVVNWDLNSIEFIHWGRPINCFIHPNIPNKSLSNKGYEQDLYKMLSFNVSDKLEGVTGKFGLGFKTVYLLTDKPEVASGDLFFSVCGGILPKSINELDHKEEVRKKLRSHCVQKSADGTLIKLPVDSSLNVNTSDIVQEFQAHISLMLVFAKQIKHCKLSGSNSKILTWQPTRILGINTIEYGQIDLFVSDVEQESISHRLLNFCLPSGNVALVIPPSLKNESPLTSLPTFWVTNPTKESLNVKFVVNGNFDITTGRTSLDRNSIHNEKLIEQIGEHLGENLCKLFSLSEENWQALRQALSLNEKVDAYSFWEFLWNIFVIDCLKLNSDSTTMNLLQTGFSGEYRSFGYLISCHAALPNGLFSQARQLVRIDRIEYKVTGLLSEREIFDTVLTWSSFIKHYPASCLVHQKIWQNVEKILYTDRYQPNTLKIPDILVKELGDRHIDPDKSYSIGQIINPKNMNAWQTSQSLEHNSIYETIVGVPVLFRNQAGGYVEARSLLNACTDNNEENLLSSFALIEQILHSDYTGAALQFFLACRPQHKSISEFISIETIVDWAKAANTDTQKQAVLKYLLNGERKIEFVDRLSQSISNTWMENDSRIRELLKITAIQEQAQKAIGGEIRWDELFFNSNLLNEMSSHKLRETAAPEQPLQSTNQLLQDVWDWWEQTYQTEIIKYNQRLYPISTEELQQRLRLQDCDRSAWLMLFFIGATHTMGRTTHDQHRDFIRFCTDRGWWDTFSNLAPQDYSKQWINVLDCYLDSLSTKTEWYYWMEKYPTIYQISKYLDEYRYSFLGANRIQNHFNLNVLTNPRVATYQSGGGVDAPPLRIGIGANFVIRELVRLKIIEPTQYVLPHCFVPRARIRKVMLWLGCEGLQEANYEHSKEIYQFLKKQFSTLKITGDPSFQRCFDIPFELYSDNRNLNLEGLQVQDDVGWYEGIPD